MSDSPDRPAGTERLLIGRQAVPHDPAGCSLCEAIGGGPIGQQDTVEMTFVPWIDTELVERGATTVTIFTFHDETSDVATGMLLEDLLDQSTLDWLEKVKRRGEV